MSWRTILITRRAKLSYQNNYLIVRGDETNTVHLSEIYSIIIDSTQVSASTYLVSELMKRKIKIVFCDEKHNPQGEVIPYYGAHNTSKRIVSQIAWDTERKGQVWTEIVRAKITNQARLLKKHSKETAIALTQYASQITWNDETNREGHAAKVYFNSLYGKDFSRDFDSDVNAALNYGYAIVLSSFNKEIVARGYITQLGINHRNEFNQFNFSSDLMEPYRVIIDQFVYENKDRAFDQEYRQDLVQLFSLRRVKINSSVYFLANAIVLYVESVLSAMESSGSVVLTCYEL